MTAPSEAEEESEDDDEEEDNDGDVAVGFDSAAGSTLVAAKVGICLRIYFDFFLIKYIICSFFLKIIIYY